MERKRTWCSAHGFYCAVSAGECPWHDPTVDKGTYTAIKNKPGFYECDVCGDGSQGFGSLEGQVHQYCMGTTWNDN